MNIYLKAKNGFYGRIADILVEEDGYIMIMLESETDGIEWFDGKDLEPCDHAEIKEG